MPVIFGSVDAEALAVVVVKRAESPATPVKLDVLADEIINRNGIFDSFGFGVTVNPF